MSRIILTVEITDQELKILAVSGKSRLTGIPPGKKLNFDLIPIPTGVIDQGILLNKEVFHGLIQSYLEKRKLVGPIIINILIPSQLGFIRAFRLPWIARNDRASAIGFLIEEEVPIPVSDLLSDYLILEDNKERNIFHIMIGAIRSSSVRDYIEVFQQANIQVEKIDFAILALGYALGLNNDEESVCLQVENNTLQLILFNGIIPEVVRTFSIDPITAQPEAEWESEIQRVLLFYGSQYAGISLKKNIYITGEEITEVIAERLHKAGLVSRICKADLIRMPDSWKKCFQTWPENAKTVITYALRNFSDKKSINLWRKQADRKRKDFLYKINAISFVLILVTSFLIWFPLQIRENKLQNEAEQLRSKGKELLTISNRQEAQNKAWFYAREYPFYIGEQLAKIQHLLPNGVQLTNLEYKQGGLCLQGTTDNAEKFEELVAALINSGLDRPQLTTYQKTDQASTKFVLKTGFSHKEKAFSKS
jgi:type IV pilus assembly protein PilM